tara:strand:- start:21 stop:335 length:315 start_codon:yes stop_codon:yes gene_type:complete
VATTAQERVEAKVEVALAKLDEDSDDFLDIDNAFVEDDADTLVEMGVISESLADAWEAEQAEYRAEWEAAHPPKDKAGELFKFGLVMAGIYVVVGAMTANDAGG